MIPTQNPRSALPILLSVVFLLAAIVGGGWFMCRGASALYTAHVSTNWPSTKALMTESTVQRVDEFEPTFISLVAYTYEVGSQSFTGSSVYPGDSPSSSYRRRLVKHYPKGSVQTVWYKPTDPSRAVLVTGVHRYTFLLFLFGLVVFTFGLTFSLISYLAPKYGTPDARGGYHFALNHLVSKICMVCFSIIAAQFALIWYVYR